MRLVANWINGIYLRDLLEEVRGSKSCEEVSAAVAYVTFADYLIDFCVEADVPLKLFCLFNSEARPSPGPVARCLDRFTRGWQLWFTANYYHPKIIWFRGAGAYVGSANLSQAAWDWNTEAGFFFEQDEMARYSLDTQLTAFFEAIKPRFRRATREDLDAIKLLAKDAQELNSAKERLRDRFQKLVATVPGSDSPAAVEHHVSPVKVAFVQDWTSTLETLRRMQSRLDLFHKKSGRRWVPPNTPLAFEVDQALNHYYEKYVLGGDLERLHELNVRDSEEATDQMFGEWITEEIPEEGRLLLEEWYPTVRALLQREHLKHFTLEQWKTICSRCNAIREVAKHLRPATLGKPSGTTATLDEHAEWYAEFTWNQRTEGGRTLAEMLHYLVWEDQPLAPDRVWNVANEREWHLPYFGIGSAGEIIGLARPEDFPPRNNRISRALFALGFDVLHDTY